MTLEQQRRMREPLADRMRPRTLDEFVGQSNVVGKGQPLRNIIESGQLFSMIFWGPPGCGKTTLASIILNKAKQQHDHVFRFSAATASIRDIKTVMRQAEQSHMMGQTTVVFVDEIHRFNKSQQDAFLSYTENGSIVLLGATTENPSFSVNSALVSRCKVYVFHQLKDDDIYQLLKRTLKSPYGFPGYTVKTTDAVLKLIARFANGDARKGLNTLAMAADNGHVPGTKTIQITEKGLKPLLGRRFLLYDKHGDEHYDLISALHKSVRNSDVDSAIYWLYRMLEGGEDPVYIARRVIRMSSEDVGMADPGALTTCVSAYQACKLIGMPECDLALAEAVVRLTLDPKSNALNVASHLVKADVQQTMSAPVPLQIRNAPTRLMDKLGYGEHYKYAENYQDHTTAMRTMPKALVGHHYYYPSGFGLESHCAARMKQLCEIKRRHKEYGDRRIPGHHDYEN